MCRESQDIGCYETAIAEARKQGLEPHIVQILSDAHDAMQVTQNQIPRDRCKEIFIDKNDPHVGACFGK